MVQLTRDEIIHIVGTVDDSIVIDIIKTGANTVQLIEAFNWLSEDDIMAETTRREPRGVIAELIEILRRDEIPTEPEI